MKLVKFKPSSTLTDPVEFIREVLERLQKVGITSEPLTQITMVVRTESDQVVVFSNGNNSAECVYEMTCGIRSVMDDGCYNLST